MDSLTDNTTGCYYNRTVKFFYEESGKNISDHWRRRDYVIVTLGMSVCFIVIFSNLLVIAAILKNRRFHFPIYYLLGNLALADLFSGAIVNIVSLLLMELVVFSRLTTVMQTWMFLCLFVHFVSSTSSQLRCLTSKVQHTQIASHLGSTWFEHCFYWGLMSVDSGKSHSGAFGCIYAANAAVMHDKSLPICRPTKQWLWVFLLSL